MCKQVISRFQARIVVLGVGLALASPASFFQQIPTPHGVRSGPAATSPSEVAAGKSLFDAKCEVCHSANTNERRIGPALKGVKDGKLPSGKTASAETISEQLNTGGGGMPVFRELLNDEEKANIAAYVMTL